MPVNWFRSRCRSVMEGLESQDDGPLPWYSRWPKAGASPAYAAALAVSGDAVVSLLVVVPVVEVDDDAVSAVPERTSGGTG